MYQNKITEKSKWIYMHSEFNVIDLDSATCTSDSDQEDAIL